MYCAVMYCTFFSISYVGYCPPLLLFLQCLTNLSLDPVFMLEQHWLKPENIVNNFCICAGIATLVLNNYLAGRLHGRVSRARETPHQKNDGEATCLAD